MSVAAIECSLSNAGCHSNLVHAGSPHAMLGEEALGSLQNALAMLRRVTPFVPLMGPEQLREARRPRAIMKIFAHCSHPLTGGQLSVTMSYMDRCPHRL